MVMEEYSLLIMLGNASHETSPAFKRRYATRQRFPTQARGLKSTATITAPLMRCQMVMECNFKFSGEVLFAMRCSIWSRLTKERDLLFAREWRQRLGACPP